MHSHPIESTYTFASLIPQMVISFMLVAYLTAVLCYNQKRRKWNRWRTASFISGILLLSIAMMPSLMQFAHRDFGGHMIGHLLIGMFAPIGLVLGAPLTLALAVVPSKAARMLSQILASAPFHLLSHPITALVLNIGGMYVLYLTPIYAMSLHHSFLHYLIHLHFFAAGYLFTWSIVGPDPAPRRPALRVRGVVLFISIAAHAYLSKFMYAYLWPRNTPHSEEQIRQAAQIMYYGGDLSELLLTVALFAIWYQKKGRPHYTLHPLIT